MLAPIRPHIIRPRPALRAAQPEAQRGNRNGAGKARHVDTGASAAVARCEDRSHAEAAHVSKVHGRTVESARHAPESESWRLWRPARRSLASAPPATHGEGLLRWAGLCR